MKRLLLYILLPLALLACRRITPTTPTTYSATFTSCYLEYYGQAYDSVPRHVFALDLYSDGVDLDSTRIIRGTGNNLYLSDIFLADSLFTEPRLPAGTYHSDTSTLSYTFLPGQDFEGTPTGIYLLSIADDAVSSIRVLDSGRFVLTLTPDSLYDLRFTLYYTASSSASSRPQVTTYEAHFEGPITYEDRR